MKQPVHPDVLRPRLKRREAGLKLALWTVVILAVIAAWVAMLAFVYVSKGIDDAFVFFGISFGLAVALIPLFVMACEITNPLAEYLDAAYDLKVIENRAAWNAQQEELRRLRNIMKEEGL